MGRNEGKKKQELFSNAIRGRKIPLLTLDNKWYRLLDEVGRAEVKGLEEQLNDLLKRQGKINTETKNIKKLKKKLMNEIVTMVDEIDQNGNEALQKKVAEHKRLVEECNEKLEDYKEEAMDLPREIERLNTELMLLTMENCYDTMQENTEGIQEIAAWVAQIRVELKKRLIRKQEMEQRNHDIYAYMHDLFGADVVDLFDMKYNPEEQHPVAPKASSGENGKKADDNKKVGENGKRAEGKETE